jgi:hypothetical protein
MESLFSITKVDFTPSDLIVQMVVSNNIVILALSNNSLCKIDLEKPADIFSLIYLSCFYVLFLATFYIVVT